MTEILTSLLNDTLKMVTLDREAALNQGGQVKADRQSY